MPAQPDVILERHTKHTILIKGARANNLRNIDVELPKNNLIVVTGLSGSGKSSLVMDTLYAEGQRRYVESLSSYARQFLMRMKKPDVDYIRGICPAIAIEQKVSSRNARSTVGSMTEIHDYLRLLFARIGHTISPVSGREVQKDQVSDVIDFILSLSEGEKVQLFIPLQHKYRDRTLKQELELLLQKGFTRIYREDSLTKVEDLLESGDPVLERRIDSLQDREILILVDRFVARQEDEENTKRIGDSVQTAFLESEGDCIVFDEKGQVHPFNNRFEIDGISFLEPTPQLFNYNNSFGACKNCEGYGKVMGIDERKVIPDQSLSVYEGAVACWKGEKSGKWFDQFISHAEEVDFPIHRPYQDLTEEQNKILWDGTDEIWGIHSYFESLEQKLYKIQNRVILARFRGRTACPLCKGKRLRPEAAYVRVAGKAITELMDIPLEKLLEFFREIDLPPYDRKLASRILLEIETRLDILVKMGLGYLTLERRSATLSGGETQRINLTRTIGSNLTSSLYILDEPSIGLHPRDTGRLIEVLQKLKSLGNTVVVVEHEEEMIKSADFILDIGPGAGIHGGEVVFGGPYCSFVESAPESLTAAYIKGDKRIPVPVHRRTVSNFIKVRDARQYNLKNISVRFPLNAMTVVTGVSGSGKTTLVQDILLPSMKRFLDEPFPTAPGTHGGIEGPLDRIDMLEFINQNPIGKSSRSNPVTYVKAYDAIRKLMADQHLSKIHGFKPRHFSFNVEGGRCETCKGEGETLVEMQFLADVKLTCEDCKGQRFKDEVLEVTYKGKNIYDVLNLSIEESLEFFSEHQDIIQKIKPLSDVGLGYIKLGQSSSTLSGGEAQRVKLASFLSKDQQDKHILFIFDEPTTGLHFHDIRKLLEAFDALIDNGHTVIIVEHNMEVIKNADWVVDLGPGGGEEGGYLLFEGRPEDLIHCEKSHTAPFLAEKMESVTASTT